MIITGFILVVATCWVAFSFCGMYRITQLTRARRAQKQAFNLACRETGKNAKRKAIARFPNTDDIIEEWDEWHEAACDAFFYPKSSKVFFFFQPFDVLKSVYTEDEIRTFSSACTFDEWAEIISEKV